MIARARALRLAFPAAAVVVAVCLMFASVSSVYASTGLLKLSSDPFTNTASQHKTEVEPDTLAFGSTIVSAFQVGRIFGGGSADIGFATSSNSGRSFTSGFLPSATTSSTPAGIYSAASDASVAYDAKHGVWLISFLGLHPNGTAAVDVLVSRSTDGGFTWSSPVVVTADQHFNDKNWSVCDNTASSPFYGNCYTEYDDNSLGDLIQMSTSTDGGLTWSAAQTTGNRAHGIGGQPLVQPSGNLIVPIIGFAGRNFLMLSFTSADGGASWSKTNTIARVAFHNPAGGIRADIPLPSAEMDAAGTAYVVWSDCHFEPTCNASDLVLSTSADGKSWSKVARIPSDPRGSGVDHFVPGLAVDRSTSGSTAHLEVAYYYYPNANCTATTCQLDVGVSSSADGGASWTSNAQLAGPMSLSWLPNTSQGVMVGDYISTSFDHTPAFPAFAVAHAPSGGVFDEAIYTEQGGVTVGSGAQFTDHTDASSNDQLTSSSVTAQ